MALSLSLSVRPGWTRPDSSSIGLSACALTGADATSTATGARTPRRMTKPSVGGDWNEDGQLQGLLLLQRLAPDVDRGDELARLRRGDLDRDRYEVLLLVFRPGLVLTDLAGFGTRGRAR